MPGGNLNKEIFLNTVKSDAANGTANAVSMLKRSCPELSDAHCEDILGTIIGAMNMSEADKVSLVVTAPPSFSISARTTMNVVQSMINGAVLLPTNVKVAFPALSIILFIIINNAQFKSVLMPILEINLD